MTNPIIEVGARALNDYDYHMANTTDPDARYSYAEAALAAYVAMVGALTDEQCDELAEDMYAWNQGREIWQCDYSNFRAALLALVEMNDD